MKFFYAKMRVNQLGKAKLPERGIHKQVFAKIPAYPFTA